MLTPIDIQNRELKSKMGGYDKKDVDDFLEEVRAGYEELYKENQSLKEKITSLSEGIQYYKKMESTLQKALVLAEKTSAETQEAAKTQADSVMTEANAKAEAMSREAKAEIESMRREAQAQAEITKAKANRELEETRNHVRKLVQSYENYRLQFKKLAEAQIEMLDSESFSIFVPELDELMNEAPSADSVMDDPGIIPINIGSPAPFVELPDEPSEAPKVEEVPVSTASFSIPVSSEGHFSTLPEEEPATANSSISDIPAMDTETASEPAAVDMTPIEPLTEAATVEPQVTSAPEASVEVPVTDIPVDLGQIPTVDAGAQPSDPFAQDISLQTVSEEPAPEIPTADIESVTLNLGTPDLGSPAEAPADSISLDFSNTGASDITLNVSSDITDQPETSSVPLETPVSENPFEQPAADSMFMDIPGISPAATESPFESSAPAVDPVSTATQEPISMDLNMNDLIGGAEPQMSTASADLNTSDLIGGSTNMDMIGGGSDALTDPFGSADALQQPVEDLFAGSEPTAQPPVEDLFSTGAQAAQPAVDDLFGSASQTVQPAVDDMFSSSLPPVDDLLGGQPSASDLLGGMSMTTPEADTNVSSSNEFLGDLAKQEVAAAEQPDTSGNGIIADPLAEDLPLGKGSKPENDIIEMDNPFNFIDF